VLCGIAAGKTIKELAADLSVSPKSIVTYRARTWQKLYLKTTTELIRYALSHQLVD
jgi:two-component system, NarL family, invasion response regulator UvrY